MNISRRQFLRRTAAGLIVPYLAGLWTPQRARANTTIASVVSTNVAAMLNSSWGRPVALPNTWSKVRVGVLCFLDSSTVNLSGSPQWAVGLCHNTVNMIGDTTTDHFAGIITTAASWTNASQFTSFLPTNVQAIVNVAGSATNSANIATNTSINQNGNGALHRSEWFVDITKGSPNYTFNLFYPTGSVADADQAGFLSDVANPAPSRSSYVFGTGQTLAVNEGTNGAFNTMNVWWNRTDINMNLAAVAVAVLA